jgi:RNA polymerase sigma-70 factor, ECF subfamily
LSKEKSFGQSSEKAKEAAERSRGPSPLKAIVRKAQTGDLEAFQELYSQYAKKILNYLYRMTGSREEAEDLAQDTFILAFKNIGALKDAEKFQSWLFRIAQNNVYQRFRGYQPRMESIDQEDAYELSDLQKRAAPDRDPEQSVLSSELEGHIEKVISELPEKYRTVFVLSAVQKLSYQEISEIVDRSLASVKSDIHRARVEVRNKIKEYLGDNYGMSKLL